MTLRKQDYLRIVAGRSLALQAKYEPKILHELANNLVREIEGGYLEISDVLEDVRDAYEKLGYMFYASKSIKELDHKTPYYVLVIQYHVSNFIFYCKAFLDSISNAIFHAFDLDIQKPVNIDITRQEFIYKLNNENSRIADRIKQFLDWANYLVEYRMALIHKYSLIGLSEDPTSKKIEILREPASPFTILDKTSLDEFSRELEKKYGSSTIKVDDFCREQIEHSKRLFETIISEFLKEINQKGPDVFGWEQIHLEHMSFER